MVGRKPGKSSLPGRVGHFLQRATGNGDVPVSLEVRVETEAQKRCSEAAPGVELRRRKRFEAFVALQMWSLERRPPVYVIFMIQKEGGLICCTRATDTKMVEVLKAWESFMASYIATEPENVRS